MFNRFQLGPPASPLAKNMCVAPLVPFERWHVASPIAAELHPISSDMQRIHQQTKIRLLHIGQDPWIIDLAMLSPSKT